MPFDIGINFRETAGFVTDGANETYCTHNDAYPTTRGGATFGWPATSANDLDRNAGNDRRLAGIVYQAVFQTDETFRLDLPAAGDYELHIAIGDAGGGHTDMKAVIKDDASTLLTLGPYNVASNAFRDATGTEYSAANWPGSETGTVLTFTSTICNVTIGNGAGAADNSALAHIRLVQQAAAASDMPLVGPVGAHIGRRVQMIGY